MTARNYKNIIVRMPNWLGDLVMATPVLADLRKTFPKAKITALCQGKMGELLIGNCAIDQILSFEKPKNFFSKPLQILKKEYDLAILLTNSFSSAWWFYRARVKERLGFAKDYRSFLLTMKAPFPREERHLVLSYKKLIENIGIPRSDSVPELFPSSKEQEEAFKFLKTQGVPENASLIGFNPLAAYGEAKCWPKHRFRSLALKLAKNPNQYLLFFGDKSGTFAIEEICHQCPKNVINLAGKTTLRQLMSCISLCSLFVTNDSGPMHIAAALKTPLLALFGSTNEKVTGPYQHGTLIHKHVACSPCYLRKCPIDFKCMNSIEVDEVYAHISQMQKKG